MVIFHFRGRILNCHQSWHIRNLDCNLCCFLLSWIRELYYIWLHFCLVHLLTVIFTQFQPPTLIFRIFRDYFRVRQCSVFTQWLPFFSLSLFLNLTTHLQSILSVFRFLKMAVWFEVWLRLSLWWIHKDSPSPHKKKNNKTIKVDFFFIPLFCFSIFI